MRLQVCVFYLVLRGLDTIEDDPNFPAAQKPPLLTTFHQKLYERGWRLSGCGESRYYVELMEHFDRVVDVFLGLKKEYGREGAGCALSSSSSLLTCNADCGSQIPGRDCGNHQADGRRHDRVPGEGSGDHR